MLGKLIKWEFKSTAKLMFITYGALAIATVMGAVSLYQLNDANSQTSTMHFVLWTVLLGIYFFAIIGIYTGDFIYLCSHYYKTTYSAQGYLTHTLPVSPYSVFGAKVLSALLWMLISSLLFILSGLIVLQIASEGMLWRQITEIMNWKEIGKEFYELTGISVSVFILLLLFNFLLALLTYLLFVYASMAIGQLFNTSRTGFSILAGFCLYLLGQALSLIFLSVSGYSRLFSALPLSLARTTRFIFLWGTLLNVITAVFLYIICIYINKKRLNLE